jgi:hypothetical protein
MEAWIEVDGTAMEPGMVVSADRLQATGLTVNLACTPSEPCETCPVTGNILLELYADAQDDGGDWQGDARRGRAAELGQAVAVGDGNDGRATASVAALPSVASVYFLGGFGSRF